MELAKVIGTVQATQKYEGLEGVKLLIIQPLDQYLQNVSAPLVACDTVRSGVGDIIYWIGGREAALALSNTYVPVDASIVGIVDKVDLGNRKANIILQEYI